MNPTTLQKEIARRSFDFRPALLVASLLLAAVIGSLIALVAAEVRHVSAPPAEPLPAVLATPLPPPPPPAPSTCSETVVRSTIARSVVETTRKQVARAASNGARPQCARFVPAIRDGKPSGIKLYAIRPGSFFGLVGIENGDAIRRVDGIDLSTPDRAFEAYRRITTMKPEHITIELTRNGCPLVLLVSVT
jgi:hypothetical protein